LDPDVELMLKFTKGDISAFEQILKKYKDIVINFAYRFVQNYPEAEDIAQEVFLRIHNSARSYKPQAKFSTWVYKITANLSLNYLRSRKHLPTVFLDETLEIPEQITAEKDFEKKELTKKVKEALNSLPENQRLAIILKKYENFSYEEIGKIIGCSISAVDSLIQRAKKNLKQKLEPYIKQ